MSSAFGPDVESEEYDETADKHDEAADHLNNNSAANIDAPYERAAHVRAAESDRH